MLGFVDQERNIKVFRVHTTEDGTVSRERIGLIPKRDFEIGPDLEDLEPDEQKELRDVIAFYSEAAELKAQYAFLNFPETCRIVVEQAINEDSDLKRKIILMSLIEGLRQLRKFERVAPEEPATKRSSKAKAAASAQT